MEHYRLRKYRGPETWARVREAYVAGESGPSVARRFDVGLANLRKKAREEGWDRRSTAKRLERESPARRETPPSGPEAGIHERPSREETSAEEDFSAFDPDAAMGLAMRRVVSAVDKGRAAEAQGLIRAAEGLRRLTQPSAGPGRRALTPQEMEAEAQARQAEAAATHARVAERLNRLVEHLAHELLAQRPQGVPAPYAPFVYAFRARHFGPQIEAADHAHAVAMGWPLDLWDADGRLKTGITRGPSGGAPAATTPPSEGAGPEHCCAWTEQTEAGARAGREADYGMAWEG